MDRNISVHSFKIFHWKLFRLVISGKLMIPMVTCSGMSEQASMISGYSQTIKICFSAPQTREILRVERKITPHELASPRRRMAYVAFRRFVASIVRFELMNLCVVDAHNLNKRGGSLRVRENSRLSSVMKPAGIIMLCTIQPITKNNPSCMVHATALLPSPLWLSSSPSDPSSLSFSSPLRFSLIFSRFSSFPPPPRSLFPTLLFW